MEELRQDEIIEEIEEERKWCVYMHTCKANNKVYIGITCQNPQLRWRTDGSGYVGSTYFWNAIQKYGWDNFTHEIIIDGLTRDEACKKEIELIELYDSTNTHKGYNLSKGGDLGSFGLEISEETRKKISEANKGRIVSEETREKISKSEKGKFVSEETRRKISASLKGKYTGELHPLWGVKQSEESKQKNRESHMGKKASEETKKKMSQTHKQRLLNPKNHPNYGKHLSETHRKNIGRANIGRTISGEHKQLLSELHSIAVIQLTQDGRFICEYPSIKVAEQVTGTPHHISDCCGGKRKTCGGFCWMYKEDYEKQFENLNNDKKEK